MFDRPEPARPLSPAAKAWRFLQLLARPAVARKLGTLVTEGYLAQTGWVRGLVSASVVNSGGQPQPWATFPFIDFIEPRLRGNWSVFEFGAGASTLFYAARVREVFAVEHDSRFADKLMAQLPANAHVSVVPAGTRAYAEAVAGSVPLQLISVDGEDRVSCVVAALRRLAADGVLVLDDAERMEYAPARVAMAGAGFRSVEFWGLASGVTERKCTTVFYRTENVLGL